MPHRPLHLASLVLAGLVAFHPLSALACEAPAAAEISAADQARMAIFPTSRSQGLAEALMATSNSDRSIVSGLFDRPDGAANAISDGDYRCRTIKLGGNLPLIVYDFFQCRISEDGTKIDKISGSQRFSGTLAATGSALFYRGALHYGNEGSIVYGADRERDQVGCLYQIEDGIPGHYRLELPRPQFESTHDVIELVARD
ncbi:DUF4893 domain-containing protein [Devosia chinhatensis]|uniref:DUF4893 domain-containing protein n=1 Tax=Devosia chinhatensis TaxID=429727 RepID=UPI000A81B1D3|nr:DUF4893 domain-containing protein [Devosia chinhatensis]